MSSIGQASAALEIAVDRIVKDVGQQAVSRGTRAVNAIRNAELDVLKGQRSGRVYRKPHSKSTYRASAPGEPPARRTGNLRLHWHGDVKGGQASSGGVQITAQLESEHDYSGILENGSPGGMIAPRPFKDRIIEKAMPEITAIYNEPYS